MAQDGSSILSRLAHIEMDKRTEGSWYICAHRNTAKYTGTTLPNERMKTQVKDKSTSEHYRWGANCDSWVLVDTEGLSVKQESMPVGTKEKMHFHAQAQQFFFILKGTATFYLENEKQVVAAHQGLRIKPNTNHFIANEADKPLDFLVVSQPSTNNDRMLVLS